MQNAVYLISKANLSNLPAYTVQFTRNEDEEVPGRLPHKGAELEVAEAPMLVAPC